MEEQILDDIEKAANVLIKTIEQYTHGKAVVLWGIKDEEETVEGIATSTGINYAELTSLMFGLNGRAYDFVVRDLNT